MIGDRTLTRQDMLDDPERSRRLEAYDDRLHDLMDRDITFNEAGGMELRTISLSEEAAEALAVLLQRDRSGPTRWWAVRGIDRGRIEVG